MRITLVSLLALMVLIGSSQGISKTACEHRTMVLRCFHGKVIKIDGARYGRTDRYTCGRESNTRCAARSSLRVMRSRCDGRSYCWTVASNGIFGDPCRGTLKYLRVWYRCVVPPPRVYTHVVCEHHTMHLSCRAGQRLRITYALYGRRDRRTCHRNWQVWNTRCASRHSFTEVRRRCQGRRSCSVPARNSVFGDPCGGTYKYLKVKYYCS